MLQRLQQQNQAFRETTEKLHEDNVTLQRVIDGLRNHTIQLEQKLQIYQHEYQNLQENFRRVLIERDNLACYTRM